MPTVDVLCLAYSIKHHDRCVAGVRLDTGEWVRPVSARNDGALRESECQLDVGRAVRPLDIVRMPLAEARPEPHQPENWLVGRGGWQLKSDLRGQAARAALDDVVDTGPTLLGDTDDSIDCDWIAENGVSASLTLVRVRRPRFEVNHWRRLRARFTLSGSYYDLSVTDLAPWATDAFHAGEHHPDTDWCLTVSLAEPYVEKNRCYKLVAAGIDLGTL